MTSKITKPDARGRQQPQYRRICPECNQPFMGSLVASFCSAKHKQAFHTRSMKRGQMLTPLAMAWRGGRGQKEISRRAYAEQCRLLDMWNAEDRAAGRMTMAEYTERKLKNGWTAANAIRD